MYTVKRRKTSLVQVGTSYTELKDRTTQIGSQGGNILIQTSVLDISLMMSSSETICLTNTRQ